MRGTLDTRKKIAIIIVGLVLAVATVLVSESLYKYTLILVYVYSMFIMKYTGYLEKRDIFKELNRKASVKDNILMATALVLSLALIVTSIAYTSLYRYTAVLLYIYDIVIMIDDYSIRCKEES